MKQMNETSLVILWKPVLSKPPQLKKASPKGTPPSLLGPKLHMGEKG
jgi:hypothetical protein